MSNVTTKMLRDLLERVESGEVILTDFDVSNDLEDGKLTGEQRFYITTAPGQDAIARFQASMDKFNEAANFIKPPRPYRPTEEAEARIEWAYKILADYKQGVIENGVFLQVASQSLKTLNKQLRNFKPQDVMYQKIAAVMERLNCLKRGVPKNE